MKLMERQWTFEWSSSGTLDDESALDEQGKTAARMLPQQQLKLCVMPREQHQQFEIQSTVEGAPLEPIVEFLTDAARQKLAQELEPACLDDIRR